MYPFIWLLIAKKCDPHNDICVFGKISSEIRLFQTGFQKNVSGLLKNTSWTRNQVPSFPVRTFDARRSDKRLLDKLPSHMSCATKGGTMFSFRSYLVLVVIHYYNSARSSREDEGGKHKMLHSFAR